MDTDLPADLRHGLDMLAQGKSRRDMARRAAAMSRNYRGGGRSDAIDNADDALAYAFVRLPATFAAMTAVLAAVSEVCPEFSPRSLLDVGAGPGTAAFAAVRHLPDLGHIRLIDHNPHLRALALTLLAQSPTPALRHAAYEQGDLADLLRRSPAADLVVASYMVGELAPDALPGIADALWAKADRLLIVIEPGTPAGFSRIRALRSHVIGHGAHPGADPGAQPGVQPGVQPGAHVVGPCPHDHACPIIDPDWCHFSRHLNRSHDHQQVKEAALPFEDEKFSYVALARAEPRRIAARVLAPPRVTKGAVTAKLCTPDGIVTAVADRRDRERYKHRKGWRWGDAVGDVKDPDAGDHPG